MTTIFPKISRFFSAAICGAIGLKPPPDHGCRPFDRNSRWSAGWSLVPSPAAIGCSDHDRCRHRRISVLAVVAGCLAIASSGDSVHVTGKPEFRNISVVGLRDGGLIFRGQSGELLRIPLVEITAISLESLPEFSKGEGLAAAEQWDAAAECYSAEIVPANDWKRTLLLIRALRTYEQTDRFADAVRAYVSLLQAIGPQWVTKPPRNVGVAGGSQNAAVRALLADVLKSESPSSAAADLLRLQTELFIIDDIEDAPPASQPAGRPVGSARRSSARRGPIGPAIRLRGDSVVFDAAARALDMGNGFDALRMLDRARPMVPDAENHRLRLLDARIRVESSDPAAAAAELVTLSESAPPAVAIEALYYVAVAHHRMGREDVAERSLHRLLEREIADATLRVRAESLLREIQSPQGAKPPASVPPSESK